MSRSPIDPGIHATPCGIIDLGCDDRHLAVARVSLGWASDLLANRVPEEPTLLQSPATYARDRHEGVGLHLWFEGLDTRLDIRREGVMETRLLIGPRMRGTTHHIEAFMEDREGGPAAARRFIDAFLVHLDGLETRAVGDIETIRRLDLLEAVEAHVRTSRPLPDDIAFDGLLGGTSFVQTHHHGPVEAATPWSPLRARVLTGWDHPGRERLTAAERRLWTDPPVLTMTTHIAARKLNPASLKDEFAKQVVITIGALTAPARPDAPVMEDMRRLQRLMPPPPMRRSGSVR